MATTYNAYIGTVSGSLFLLASNLESAAMASTFIASEVGLASYETTYYWRVDAVNEFGTTEGTEWSFSTIEFDEITPTYYYGGYYYYLLPGGSHPADGGVEDTDYVVVDYYNIMRTKQRLVAATNNKIYYENN